MFADHSFGLEKQAASRRKLGEHFERRRILKDAQEAHVVGTKPHLRREQSSWAADQERAADTCVVEFYENAMGLRVERRKPGYSWAGEKSGAKKLVGEGDERHLESVGGEGGGKRGRCKGATTAAMARMRDKMYKVDRRVLPVMLTLGWPKAQSPGPERAKECLDAFLHALTRKFKKAAGFWKLEFGEISGLPHFHLLLWGAQPYYKWVASTWYRICRTGNFEHLSAGTRIESLRSYRGTLAYAGKKYMSKAAPSPEGWGRVWGMFNKAGIPWDLPMVVEAPGRVGMWFARTLRRYMRAKTGGKNRKGGRGRVLWQTPDFAAQWLRVLEWACDIPEPSKYSLVPVSVPF